MMAKSSLIVLYLASLIAAQSSFTPLRPPSIPLAVRSPYISTWQQAGSNGGNGGYLAGQWPSFWAGAVTGWAGLVRVDNVSYVWMGDPTGIDLYANQSAFEYTSTRSIFTMQVGGSVELKATFLSPVVPDDLMRSSLPYSYLDVEVKSVDGKEHDLQLYTDISAEWVSGDRSSIAEWSYDTTQEDSSPSQFGPVPSPTWPTSQKPKTFGTVTGFSVPTAVTHSAIHTHPPEQGHRPPPRESQPSHEQSSNSPQETNDGGVAYHKVFRQSQLLFTEINQQTEYGNWYYATDDAATLTHQSGADVTVRQQFTREGALDDTADTNYRPINDAFPVFGFSRNLGSVGSSSANVVFQLSLHQENAVQFLGRDGVASVPSLWTSYFSDDIHALKFFYDDYDKASSLATEFDDKVKEDSLAAAGQDYLSLTTLAARQAFATIEFTNTPTEPWLFMKEISSNGNVNTADVIFPFHPIAIYSNPALLRYLLDPVYINQESGNWPNSYAIHDIGASFPNATGHPDGTAEAQPLEECGNMVLMTLAYAQRTDDNAYLAQHYDILNAWTQYLILEARIPADQISTDDFAGSLANQTNLALKGILGISAMSQIAHRTGHAADAANYSSIANDYMADWQTLAFAWDASPPHAKLSYGNDTFDTSASWGLLYNLYTDRELGLDLVPKRIYDVQTEFYQTVFDAYGVPLDTRHSYTKGKSKPNPPQDNGNHTHQSSFSSKPVDWQLFIAAISPSSLKARFISTIASWLNNTSTNFAFTDLYDAVTGSYPPGITFSARPVVGGVFALLALGGG
ncbi:hypothetical protein Q7P37_007711 [Cladosporium fusiforme]